MGVIKIITQTTLAILLGFQISVAQDTTLIKQDSASKPPRIYTKPLVDTQSVKVQKKQKKNGS